MRFLILVFIAVPAAAAPRGKVERVERKKPAEVARWCQIAANRDGGEDMCAGRAATGETVTMLDLGTGLVAGVYRIESSAPKTDAIYCPDRTNLYGITGTMIWSAGTLGNRLISVRGVTLDPHVARALTDQPLPAGAPDTAQAEIAIDTDGNGTADIVITQYPCDDHGKPSMRQPLTGLCFDTWQRRGDVLQPVHQDYVPLCIQ